MTEWANFYFIIGGRGAGKTYSTLAYLYNTKKQFGFIRRTKDEIKTLCELDTSPDRKISHSPFKDLNADFVLNIKAVESGRDSFNFIDCESWDNNSGNVIGHIMPLSTVGKIKGASYKDIEYIFYDEFIPLPTERGTKNDGFNLMQLYETVARNREIKGQSPVKLICCANSHTVANPVFLEFGLVNIASQMAMNKQTICDLYDRGIRIIMLSDKSEFTEKKKETALYKAIPKNSRMYESSLSNNFIGDDFHDIKHKSIKGWRVVYEIINNTGEHYICEKNGQFYFTSQNAGIGNRCIYDLRKIDQRKKATSELLTSGIWYDFLNGLYTFETYEEKVLFFTMLDKKME